MKVLVAAAHPDDEVLGCGGTIPRLAREGHEVCVALLGEGVTSRYDSRTRAAKKLVERLHECTQNAARLLGARETFFYDLPDNRFDTVPLLNIVKTIEGLIETLQPDIIYTHHAGDLNIDHQIVHRAVLTAARPVAHQVTREVYAFEVPSSTDWAFQELQPVFRPNVFVDIEATLELKLKAMRLYRSEARPFPHPRSPRALRAIAERWGSTAGLKAAEAFQLVRSVR